MGIELSLGLFLIAFSLICLMSMVSADQQSDGPPAQQPSYAEHLTPYQNPNPDYHADFPSIARAEDGSLVVILRKCGPWAYEANFQRGISTFFDADTELIVIRSTDGGQSFKPIASNPVFAGLAIDPVIRLLSDGRLMACAIVGEAATRPQRPQMKGVLHRHFPRFDTVITLEGVSVRFSEDNGVTWSKPSMFTPFAPESLYNLRKPLELADGTLLVPLAVGYPWRSRFVGLSRSWDMGQSWGDETYVMEDPQGRYRWAAGTDYWMPTLGLQSNGALVCAYVESPKEPPAGFYSRILTSTSSDAGYTWHPPTPTGLDGGFPNIITLPDDRYLMTFASRYGSVGALEAAFSSDGHNWETRLTLRSEEGYEFYYPDSVQLPGGDIFTVYMASPPSRVRTVGAVRWRLPEQ